MRVKTYITILLSIAVSMAAGLAITIGVLIREQERAQALSGEASSEFQTARELAEDSHELLAGMDILTAESSGVVLIVQRQVEHCRAGFARLLDLHTFGSEDLLRDTSEAFERMVAQGKRAAFVGEAAARNSELERFDTLASEYLGLLEKLLDWASHVARRQMDELQARRDRNTVVIASAGAFCAALVLLLLRWTTTRLVRPLASLAQAADRAGAQDGPVVLQEQGPAEVKQLVRSIRGFLVRVESAKQEAEATGRKATEAAEKIRVSDEHQRALNGLLQAGLKDVPLVEALEHCLDVLLSVGWLPVLPRGGILLVEEDPNVLVLKAQRNFSPSIQASCARVPFGRCLCGRAAASGQMQFADCVDHRHEISYDDMPPHGHYNVPIKSNDQVLGVIVLYLDEGYQRVKSHQDLLDAAANTIAGIIGRKQAEEALRESEEKNRTIIDTAGDAMFVADTETGIILDANKQAEKLLGMPVGEIVGMHQTKLHPKKQAEAYRKLFEDHVLCGGTFSQDLLVCKHSVNPWLFFGAAEILLRGAGHTPVRSVPCWHVRSGRRSP